MEDGGWRRDVPHVRRALKFLRSRASVTPEELVDWDAAHGRRLFDWSDASAAASWRVQQARQFMNGFRRTLDGKRVRGWISVRPGEGDARAYVSVERISEEPALREQVVDDIRRRLVVLASELKMWKLDAHERADLFKRLRDAIEG